MKESPYISQILVVGENRRFPAALIVPAFNRVIEHFEGIGIHLRSNAEVVTSDNVKALIESEIHRLNRRLGHFAQIKKFVLMAQDWSIAGGDLTPTLKLKRRQLSKKYAKEIESLYSAEKRTGTDVEMQTVTHSPGPASDAREENRV
jgi:long-chain acyl-CoA synthetase